MQVKPVTEIDHSLIRLQAKTNSQAAAARLKRFPSLANAFPVHRDFNKFKAFSCGFSRFDAFNGAKKRRKTFN
jgi:hypothetical protein